jgi:hypothetical protein
MPEDRLESLMQDSVVQVRTTERETGAGLFVAPGMIATAAFRPGRDGAWDVAWRREELSVASLEVPGANTQFIGVSPGFSGQAAALAFPEFAVVQVDGNLDHPSVLLDDELPSPDDTLCICGYRDDGLCDCPPIN